MEIRQKIVTFAGWYEKDTHIGHGSAAFDMVLVQYHRF